MSTSTADNTPSCSVENLTKSFTTTAQSLEEFSSELLDGVVLVKQLALARFPVFLVNSPSKKKDFVLKVFPQEDDHQLNLYYENESRFTELCHPNIITIHQVDDETSFSVQGKNLTVSCILMEYAPYGDLFQLIQKLGEDFTEKLARTYFRQLIEGIEYLHVNDACHFDLKLENLLIGEDGQLKIADFDLSYVKGDSHLLSKGTKYYRAPELQALQKNTGKPADIYSAGIILFVLKCQGVLPHTEEKLYKSHDLQNLLETNTEEFFKTHSVIQERDSSFFDDDFKDLFILMTKKNPKERIKVRHIKKTKWYKGPVYSPEELKKKVTKIFDH